MSDYKTVIAAFLKVDATEIGPNTIIDKSVLHGSIMLHRMHAKLAQVGCQIDNWRDIRTYGDLERAASGQAPTDGVVAGVIETVNDTGVLINPSRPAIGVDIEEMANLPQADDYREHPFYRKIFTPGEISYCILQGDPRGSFAGLFSAKEAVLKVEGGKKFNTLREIEILHDDEGKPCCPGYEVSISHSGSYAVAVALRAPHTNDSSTSLPRQEESVMPRQTQEIYVGSPKGTQLQYVALIVSFLAFAMVFVHLSR